MSAPVQNNDEEEVLLVVHKHWVGFIPDVAVVAVPALLLIAFWALSGAGGESVVHVMFTLLLPLGLLMVWNIIAILWTNYFLDMVVVTDRRLFHASQFNLAHREVHEWDIHDVRHVGVRITNVLESFFNYGALEFDMKGSREPVVFERVPNPEYISAVILKQDDRYGQLKATARKQAELLHFISHEVKGHLTKSKAAFAGIVEGDYGPVSAPLDTMAHAALEDSQKGVDTVMSILDNSDLKRGEVTIEKKPFDLSQTVNRSIVAFRNAAAQKGLVLDASIDDFCAMVGDEKKIEQHVIRNLLDNAVRYTPAGRIEVSLKKAGAAVRFSVADTGVGIAQSDMQRLFTEGGHGEHSKEANPESTGYGLFIAKQIVEAHGGRIWANSRGLGTGSTFSIEFPLK